MATLQEALTYADQDLTELDYGRDRNLPEVEVVDGVRYAIAGAEDAQHVILEPAPYLTPLDRPHYLQRLMAQQAVLGENFSVIGVEAYNPATVFTHRQRKAITNGSFSEFAANVLRVAEKVHVEDDQTFSVYGYSMGADISVQTAYDVVTNESRGVISLEALGAVEAARVAQRGLKVVKAMKDSSNSLWLNVRNSDSAYLNESWGINQEMSDEEVQKVIAGGVSTDLARYMLKGARNNLAIVRGFGTDGTVRQVDRLTHTDMTIMLGREAASRVCTSDFIKRYDTTDGVVTFTETGNDHSADDNLKSSAGRALYFSTLISDENALS